MIITIKFVAVGAVAYIKKVDSEHRKLDHIRKNYLINPVTYYITNTVPKNVNLLKISNL